MTDIYIVMNKRHILSILALILAGFTVQANAQQRTERDYVRKGNKLYADSLFQKAEENYLKAIDKNADSPEAQFNLGNAYLNEQKGEESYKQYAAAARVMESMRDKMIQSGDANAKDIKKIKDETAMAYHNMGVISYAAQDYAGAVGAYKEALKNNPADDETRYNLALAMHMLKQQQQDQQQEQNQDKQDQQEQEQQQEQDQQQQDQQQQQQQQQQQDEEQMSKENAEQMLQAANEDEKDVQERVRQMMQVQPKQKLEKDW